MGLPQPLRGGAVQHWPFTLTWSWCPLGLWCPSVSVQQPWAYSVQLMFGECLNNGATRYRLVNKYEHVFFNKSDRVVFMITYWTHWALIMSSWSSKKKCNPPSALISGQCRYIGADGVDFWRVVKCSTFSYQTHLSWTSVSCHPRAWLPRGKKSSQSAETRFWGCYASTERGGVGCQTTAMSIAWVSVSYYTNAKLVKKDLCIALNYFYFFPLVLLSYMTHKDHLQRAWRMPLS